MTEGMIATPPFGSLAMTDFCALKERLPRLPEGKPRNDKGGECQGPPKGSPRNDRGERPPKAGVVAKIIKTSINFFLDHHW